jgi:hypothetical protein
MRALRRTVVAGLLAVALVGLPALPATATIDHCPDGVADVRGTDPSWPQVDAWLESSAAAHDVPAAILKAVALRESAWDQFLSDGRVKVSSDAVCGLGIMQITADGRADAVKLAEDPAYNIDEGAKLLRAMWLQSQETQPPAGYAADDDEVLENWLYALCLYNGCSGDATYARGVAEAVADPFRRVPWYLWRYMPPAGFTLPWDVKPGYAFPAAFQARHTADGGEFVFYDHVTGTVSEVVPAITHLESAPPVVAYPERVYGPDMPAHDGATFDVTCGSCGGWRLAEGAGIAGRAHWTNTVTSSPQSSVTWYAAQSGRQRVQAYVPALGDRVLGKATYWVRPTENDDKHYPVTVDQNARKGTWVTLGDWDMNGGGKVYVDDLSTVADKPIVADAMRFLSVPSLGVGTYRQIGTNRYAGVSSITYGESLQVHVTLMDNGKALAGQPVKVYRRTVGTTAWQLAGTWTTNTAGSIVLAAKPSASTQYAARWVSPKPALVADGVSNVAGVGVRTAAKATLARTTIDSGQSVVVYASVAPNHAGQQVLLQRFYSGAWRTVQSRPLGSSSTATFSYPMSIAGCCSYSDHQFRVVKPADGDHLLGVSPPVTVTVRDTY